MCRVTATSVRTYTHYTQVHSVVIPLGFNPVYSSAMSSLGSIETPPPQPIKKSVQLVRFVNIFVWIKMIVFQENFQRAFVCGIWEECKKTYRKGLSESGFGSRIAREVPEICSVQVSEERDAFHQKWSFLGCKMTISRPPYTTRGQTRLLFALRNPLEMSMKSYSTKMTWDRDIWQILVKTASKSKPI